MGVYIQFQLVNYFLATLNVEDITSARKSYAIFGFDFKDT